MTPGRMLPLVSCPLTDRCPACAWIGTPYEQQLARKRETLSRAWQYAGLDLAVLGDIPILPVLPSGTRDRVDVQFRRENGRTTIGFSVDGVILDVDRRPKASPALEAWLRDFRTLVPPVDQGGARLRVAPDGRRGVWLDLANLDVKTLFYERHSLDVLPNEAIVEIGQRRKRLRFVDGTPRLVDPEPYPWFETLACETTVPVYGAVGGFTQPGSAVNRALIGTLMRTLPTEGVASGIWIELGAGVGNFTVPLAARGLEVVAVENDPVALLGLRRTLANQAFPTTPVVRDENFATPSAALQDLLAGARGIVADPPRSGMGRFPAALEASGPEWLVYVSCYPESFAADAARLHDVGYRLEALEAVDQFPQTPHLELVARFRRPVVAPRADRHLRAFNHDLSHGRSCFQLRVRGTKVVRRKTNVTFTDRASESTFVDPTSDGREDGALRLHAKTETRLREHQLPVQAQRLGLERSEIERPGLVDEHDGAEGLRDRRKAREMFGGSRGHEYRVEFGRTGNSGFFLERFATPQKAVDAKLFEPAARFRSTGGRPNTGVGSCPEQLHRHRAHAASATSDENVGGGIFGDTKLLEEPFVRGQCRQRQCGGLGEIQRLRRQSREPRVDHLELRVRAVATEIPRIVNAIAGTKTADRWADGDDDTGGIPTENDRFLRCAGARTSHFEVDGVHGNGAHVDEEVVGAGRRRRHVERHEAFRVFHG